MRSAFAATLIAASALSAPAWAADDDPKSGAIGCGSIGQVIDVGRALLPRIQELAPTATSEPGFQDGIAWLDRDRIAELGVRLDAPVGMSFDVERDQVSMGVGFDGTIEDAIGLFELMEKDLDRGRITLQANGFDMAPTAENADAEVTRVRLADGRLTIRFDDETGSFLAPFESFPIDGGCGVVVDLEPGTLPEPMDTVQTIRFFLPMVLDGPLAPLRAQFHVSEDLPSWLTATMDEASMASSPRAARMVLSMAAPFNELILDEKVGKLLTEGAYGLLPELVRLQPGATVALFSKLPLGADAKNQPPPQLAAYLPAEPERGKKIKPGPIWRTLKRLSGEDSTMSVEKVDGHTASVKRGETSLAVRMAKTGLSVATGIDLLPEEGEPWGSEAHVEASRGAAFVASIPNLSEILPAPGADGYSLVGRVAAEGRRLDLNFDLHGPRATGFLLTTVADVFGPNLEQMMLRARRAEVPKNLEALAAALEAAESDGYVVADLPPAPRPIDSVDAEAIAWGEGWFAFQQWEPEESVRGVYWVETTADGWVVWGAVDGDGDGEQAQYRLAPGGEVEQLSDPRAF